MKTTLTYNTIESLQKGGWKTFIDSIVASCKSLFDNNLISEREELNNGVVVKTKLKTNDISPKYATLNFQNDLIQLNKNENISLAGLMRILSLYGCKLQDTTYPVNIPHTFKIQGKFNGEVMGMAPQNRAYNHPAAAQNEDADCFAPNMSTNAFEEDTTFKYIYDVYGYNQKKPMLSYSYVYKFEQFYQVEIASNTADLTNENSWSETFGGKKCYVKKEDTYDVKVLDNNTTEKHLKSSDVAIYNFTKERMDSKYAFAYMKRNDADALLNYVIRLKSGYTVINAISDLTYIIINEKDRIDLQKSYYLYSQSTSTSNGIARPDYTSEQPFDSFAGNYKYPIIRYNEMSIGSYTTDDDEQEYELAFVEANTDFSTIYKSTFVKTEVNPFDATQSYYECEIEDGFSIYFNFYNIVGFDGTFVISDCIDDDISSLAMHVKKEQLFGADNYVKAQPLFVYQPNESDAKRYVTEIANLDKNVGGENKISYQISLDELNKTDKSVVIDKKSIVYQNTDEDVDLSIKDVFYSRKYKVCDVYKREKRYGLKKVKTGYKTVLNTTNKAEFDKMWEIYKNIEGVIKEVPNSAQSTSTSKSSGIINKMLDRIKKNNDIAINALKKISK